MATKTSTVTTISSPFLRVEEVEVFLIVGRRRRRWRSGGRGGRLNALRSATTADDDDARMMTRRRADDDDDDADESALRTAWLNKRVRSFAGVMRAVASGLPPPRTTYELSARRP